MSDLCGLFGVDCVGDLSGFMEKIGRKSEASNDILQI